MSFQREANKKIDALASKQAEFSSLGVAERAALLKELMESLRAIQDELPALADAAVRSMGYDEPEEESATIPWALEQILMADWVMSFCTRYGASLESFAKTGKCPEAEIREQNDRKIAKVYPLNGSDKMKPTKNWTVELWMQAGKEATQGAMFDVKPRANSVGLVLGAGNVGALAIVDCLHLLFQHNTVVLYKLHPIREYQMDFATKLFAPLINKGYLGLIKQGTLADSIFLVSHSKLCNIHMTGATETHDCIVWGPKEGREERIRANMPVVDLNPKTGVTVTSELGCVTPYMVCPAAEGAEWSPEELKHHALHLAICMTSNNGYYCNSPKVLIVAEGWAQKNAFLAILRGILGGLSPHAPYYPGSHKRYAAFEAAYPKMEKIKGPGFNASNKSFGEHLPWGLVTTTVDALNTAAAKAEYAFQNEPFCPLLCICEMKGVSDAKVFLEQAPGFVNEGIWGRLSCSLILHPSAAAQLPDMVDSAIAQLEYGAVVINCWSAAAYGFESGVWGAYAGAGQDGQVLERIDRVQSGIGFVNNCLAYDHVEKAVVKCPFIDTANQIGTGVMLTRELTLNLTNLLINPGLLSLVKLLCPVLFKPAAKAAFGIIAATAVAFFASRVLQEPTFE